MRAHQRINWCECLFFGRWSMCETWRHMCWEGEVGHTLTGNCRFHVWTDDNIVRSLRYSAHKTRLIPDNTPLCLGTFNSGTRFVCILLLCVCVCFHTWSLFFPNGPESRLCWQEIDFTVIKHRVHNTVKPTGAARWSHSENTAADSEQEADFHHPLIYWLFPSFINQSNGPRNDEKWWKSVDFPGLRWCLKISVFSPSPLQNHIQLIIQKREFV